MVKKAILRYKIRKANSDFSVFMSRRSNETDVANLLEFAAKKANAEQRKLVSTK